MTLSPELATPLLTDADVQEHVEAVVGRATQDRCVWLLLIDGNRRPTPVVMPLEDSPRRPEARLTDGLRHMLSHLVGQLATAAGPGSCAFVLERLGPVRVGAADEEWAEALVDAATGAGLGSLGVFSSTTAGIPATPVGAGGDGGGAGRWRP